MISNRDTLLRALHAYHGTVAAERKFRDEFLELLTHPRAFFRDHLPGHITASAWIIDSSSAFALLTHHAKLNRWLQPGGHADGDENTLAVAAKEAREETGMRSLTLVNSEIFDLDIHPIPARRDFPAHLHYDIRYLFRADMEESYTISNESHALGWIHTTDLAVRTANNESILRMAKKVRDRSLATGS